MSMSSNNRNLLNLHTQVEMWKRNKGRFINPFRALLNNLDRLYKEARTNKRLSIGRQKNMYPGNTEYFYEQIPTKIEVKNTIQEYINLIENANSEEELTVTTSMTPQH